MITISQEEVQQVEWNQVTAFEVNPIHEFEDGSICRVDRENPDQKIDRWGLYARVYGLAVWLADFKNADGADGIQAVLTAMLNVMKEKHGHVEQSS